MTMREEYERRMGAIRRDFDTGGDGVAAVAARSALVDELVGRLWAAEVESEIQKAKYESCSMFALLLDTAQ